MCAGQENGKHDVTTDYVYATRDSSLPLLTTVKRKEKS